MSRWTVIAIAWILALAASTGAQHAYDWRLPPGVPAPYVPSDNPMSVEKVELGRYLFYDVRLSGNGTQSCASCHLHERAFTDGRGRSVGSTGDVHPRGSMSLANVAYASALTWANPSPTRLERQALVPMYGDDPVELGLDRSDDWLAMFQRDARYMDLFKAAYPGATDPITRANLLKALASFERSIISVRSPYDDYHFGGDQTAISDAAKRGEALFNSASLGCSSCHGGFSFGEAEVPTGDFKAPALRNVALTAPYMHDGSAATLADAIAHPRNASRTISETFFATAAERRDLLDFLDSLTDKALIQDQRFDNPWSNEK